MFSVTSSSASPSRPPRAPRRRSPRRGSPRAARRARADRGQQLAGRFLLAALDLGHVAEADPGVGAHLAQRAALVASAASGARHRAGDGTAPWSRSSLSSVERCDDRSEDSEGNATRRRKLPVSATYRRLPRPSQADDHRERRGVASGRSGPDRRPVPVEVQLAVATPSGPRRHRRTPAPAGLPSCAVRPGHPGRAHRRRRRPAAGAPRRPSRAAHGAETTPCRARRRSARRAAPP